MLSISGQEVVERKSTMVKAMTAFVTAHAPPQPLPFTVEGTTGTDLRAHVIPLGKKELLALADGTATDLPESRALLLRPHGPTGDVDAAYFDLGQVASTLLVQLIDNEKRVVGIFLAESTVDGFFEPSPNAKEPPPSHRLAEWIGNNTGRSLRAGLDYGELPFLGVTRRLRDTRRKLLGTERSRHLFWWVFWLALIGGVLFFPWMVEVESDCTLVPEKRVKVVPEVPGRIEKVFVREGDQVKKGDKIAKLDTSALEAELLHSREDLAGANVEAEKYRGMNDPASEQIALTKVRAAEQRVKRLEQDITSATLLSPMDGVVLTKDIELTTGVYFTAGADFAVIGSADTWDLLVHLPENQIGLAEKLLAEEKKVPVRFILYAHNMSELSGLFTSRSQISQVAYPHQRENAVQENAFILTLANIQAPPDIRRGFRPDLTGRASIQVGRKPLVLMWAHDIAQWFRLKWMW
jgi:hypothetical protein